MALQPVQAVMQVTVATGGSGVGSRGRGRSSTGFMEAQMYNHNADSQHAKLGHAILSGRFTLID